MSESEVRYYLKSHDSYTKEFSNYAEALVWMQGMMLKFALLGYTFSLKPYKQDWQVTISKT